MAPALPYSFVDEGIAIMEATELIHIVGALGKAVAGTYTNLHQMVNAIDTHLHCTQIEEWHPACNGK